MRLKSNLLTRKIFYRIGQRRLSTQNYQILRDTYQRQFKLKDRHCLAQLRMDWEQHQPLKNKRVLLDVHITTATLIMIEALLKAGAQLEVTISADLVAHPKTMQVLAAAQIPFFPVIPNHKKKKYYDIVYNCGAGMQDIVPNYGMVELTHVQPGIYQAMPFPVITVDQSKTKIIETSFGTGDSLVRLIHALARKALTVMIMNFSQESNSLDLSRTYLTTFMSMLNSSQLFSLNKFMIFGFGKVGRGIASALESAGALKKNIFIVEISPESHIDAMKNGYQGLLLNPQLIKQHIPQMWAVITATGVPGILSQYFSQSDFDAVGLLINMGTFDEFGTSFSKERVLNQKKPANFILEEPTEVAYLDPTFALFLKAGKELLINPSLKKGLNPLPPELDNNELKMWLAHHGNAVWQHHHGQRETEELLSQLRQNPTIPLQELSLLVNNQRIFNRSNTPAPTL